MVTLALNKIGIAQENCLAIKPQTAVNVLQDLQLIKLKGGCDKLPRPTSDSNGSFACFYLNESYAPFFLPKSTPPLSLMITASNDLKTEKSQRDVVYLG